MTPGDVGPRLRGLREGKGLTQAGLAKQLKLDQTLISKVETGKAGLTAEIAAVAAAFFGVRAGWLLFGEGEAPAGLADAYVAGLQDALTATQETIEALRQRAIGIATGHADPVAEEGIVPLDRPPVRTLAERRVADAEAVQADARARRRRPPETG